MTSVGGAVFSIAWDDKRRFLIVGGQSVINIFKVSSAVERTDQEHPECLCASP